MRLWKASSAPRAVSSIACTRRSLSKAYPVRRFRTPDRYRVSVGPDSNGNGTLDDDEVVQSSTVCATPPPAVLVRTRPEPSDATCARGGTIVESGPDRNGDGEPDGPDFDDETPELHGTGSGVIMEASDGIGYILTNNHVAGDASQMEITLSDGRKITKATTLGADKKTDLAVVRVEADRLIAGGNRKPATFLGLR